MAQDRNPFDQFDVAPQPGAQVVVPESPLVAAKAQADLARINQQIAVTAAQNARAAEAQGLARQRFAADLAMRGMRIGANGQPEAIPGWTPPLSAANTPRITAKERTDAIAGYRAGIALDRYVADLEAQFAAGPGATTGIAGLQDYLPTEANKRFDAAGNAARGIVGQALGFTGGQLNTATEAEAAVGPFLPQSGDRDNVIRDKITRLRQLAEDARTRSVAVLGGQPDANGRITPVEDSPRQDERREIAPGFQNTAGIGGGMSGGAAPPGGGFSDAAGVQMAQRLADAYRGGADVAQLNELLAQNGYQPLTNPDDLKAIARRQPLNFDPPVVDDIRGPVGRFMGSIADSPLGAYGIGAANALTAGALDELAGGSAQMAKDYVADKYPGATFAGTLTGGALATLPAGRAVGRLGMFGRGARADLAGDALYGAAFGAGESNDNRLLGAVGGAAGAVGGNMLGTGAVRLAGKAVRGVSDPAVSYLAQRDIPMSLGQIIGNRSVAGRMMNKLESTPFVGDMLGARRLDSIRAFNREAINDALEPIGKTAQGEIGQEAIGQAQDAVSAAYDDALSGVSIRADRPFMDDLTQYVAAGRAVPVQGDQFGHIMDVKFAPLFGPGVTLDGKTAQAALQTVRGARSEFAKEGPMGGMVADNLSAIDDSINDLINRQAPGVTDKLSRANQAYASLRPIEDASISAMNGQAGQSVFTPAQLTRAVANNTRKYGGTGAAARGARQTPLMGAAQEVLPSTVPNSASADRIAALALPAVLGGGAYSLSDISPETAAAMAGLAALTSRPGSRVAQRALVKRSDGVKRIGEEIERKARIGGMFGAPIGALLLN